MVCHSTPVSVDTVWLGLKVEEFFEVLLTLFCQRCLDDQQHRKSEQAMV